MKSLFSILNNVENKSPLIKGVTGAMVVEEANKILTQLFGIEVLNHATAAYVKDDTLSFACLSSVIAQEIKLHETQILGLINRKIPACNLKKIRYLS